MANYKPLIMKDGILQQLSSADSLDAIVPNATSITLQNNHNATITKATAVYIDSNGGVKPTLSSAINSSRMIGFVDVPTGIPVSESGAIKTDGVQDGFTDLITGSQYFLSDVIEGGITNVAPSATGKYVVRVGVALSPTELYIEIAQPVGL